MITKQGQMILLMGIAIGLASLNTSAHCQTVSNAISGYEQVTATKDKIWTHNDVTVTPNTAVRVSLHVQNTAGVWVQAESVTAQSDQETFEVRLYASSVPNQWYTWLGYVCKLELRDTQNNLLHSYFFFVFSEWAEPGLMPVSTCDPCEPPPPTFVAIHDAQYIDDEYPFDHYGTANVKGFNNDGEQLMLNVYLMETHDPREFPAAYWNDPNDHYRVPLYDTIVAAGAAIDVDVNWSASWYGGEGFPDLGWPGGPANVYVCDPSTNYGYKVVARLVRIPEDPLKKGAIQAFDIEWAYHESAIGPMMLAAGSLGVGVAL